MEHQPLTLLCLAHLGWEHVWQRPQQLMSRFAQRCRVIYVDPPELGHGGEQVYLQERPGVAGVRVVRPIFPDTLLYPPDQSAQQPHPAVVPPRQAWQDGPAETDRYQQLWLELLPQVLEEAGSNTLLWVSSPLADYLVAAARPHVQLAVYDCMDDLASFRDGSSEMRQREDRLLQLVDLLFTGGYSMYEARKDRHPRVHLFPSGVDIAHYRRTQDPTTQEPAAIAHIPHPRLGYFGVLDERIDWALIAEVAHQRPKWHWVLVGPTAKVHPTEIPGGPRIHYVGQQPYEALPAFLKGFDIATMPFALNEATRYISPTKTLEYLAGGKVVLSTSVPDVVAFYQEIVYIADGVEGWLAAVEQILAAPVEEQQARLERANAILEQSSWDS
ncbi:MAG: glycosyltransferase, partial [Chloroflexota bacterium]|nr:glycosyltransferase [Chloroflexota bacterium]